MANLKKYKGQNFWHCFFRILDDLRVPNNFEIELYRAIDGLKKNGLYPDSNGRIREI